MSSKRVDQVMTFSSARGNRSVHDRHQSGNWARGRRVVFKRSGFEKNEQRLRLCMSKKDIQGSDQPVHTFYNKKNEPRPGWLHGTKKTGHEGRSNALRKSGGLALLRLPPLLGEFINLGFDWFKAGRPVPDNFGLRF